jgi:hypothetical protein
VRLCALLILLSAPAWATDVLRGRAPLRGGAPSLTDGVVAFDGAAWLDPTAVMLPADGEVVWDLGAATALDGAAIQADNNDDYQVELSDDGVSWRPWWRSGAVDGPGLQTRSGDVVGQGRFVRLHAVGGDGHYSVSELELFSQGHGGSTLLRSKWVPRHPLDVEWSWAVLGAWVLLLFTSRKLPSRLVALLGLAALGAAGALWRDTANAPLDAGRLDFIRAAVALLAFGAIARELVARRSWPAHEGVVLGVLGLAAVLGVTCFLNLGRPQFVDAGKGQPTFLHHYDMRTYYPIAKYFPELRFDGVYAASVLVVAEDRGGLDAMANLGLRDLRTHEGTTVGAARAHLEDVRARFTPERWAAFRTDMNYFRRAMGDGGFLGSMNDHGGNATPVWFLVARLLFAWTPASDGALWLGVAVDALLVVLAFVGLWRAFGLRSALVGMTVFGAMDFYQFGSNWFGAALRHDWLALWCLSLWAMATNRPRLAGALLAWSALIRAFPALAFVTLTLPVAFDLVLTIRRGRFDARAWARRHRDFFLLALGAAVTSAVLLTLSVAVFGVGAWPEWLRKVQLLDRDGHLNNIAVRTYLTATRGQWLAVVALALGVVFVVTRRERAAQAAAWGVALVPIVFNPANYYLHAMFLLVVLAREAPGQGLSVTGRLRWLVLLAMCAASWTTSLGPDLGAHFRGDTIIVVVTLLVLAGLSLIYPPALGVAGDEVGGSVSKP